jgi:hypothetical protein
MHLSNLSAGSPFDKKKLLDLKREKKRFSINNERFISFAAFSRNANSGMDFPSYFLARVSNF